LARKIIKNHETYNLFLNLYQSTNAIFPIKNAKLGPTLSTIPSIIHLNGPFEFKQRRKILGTLLEFDAIFHFFPLQNGPLVLTNKW
jgi:hypothetical protein